MRRKLLAIAALLFAVPRLTAQSDGVEFFEKKIRPALVEHCYSCHSADAKKQKGGLLLDTREATLKGGDSGPALVPGKAADSLFVKAIRFDDPEIRMPPKGKLPSHVIADFEKWIAMGAPDPRTGGGKTKAENYPSVAEGKKFWAFRPLTKPAVPEVKDIAWPKNDFDRFLLAKLESKGLTPSKDADKATLIRRATFALTGLPPTPEEIDAFVNDASPDAFVKVVDRLIASKHFGERWGRHWLDVARYADSTGGGRSLLFKESWRYRDYVVQAFNDDVPFDRFLLEQLAGDLLEAKTPEERRRLLIATAFLLLGPTNYERQDKPILEMDIIDEQIDTLGRAFLGQTIGCARCHDHKFDPIPTLDYYAMAGIFKSTKFIVHNNVSNWHEVPMPIAKSEEGAFAKHEAEANRLKAEIAKLKGQGAKSAASVKSKGILDPATLPGIVIDDSQAKKVGPWKHSMFSGAYIGAGYLYDDRGAKVDKTLTFQPDFEKSGLYEVRVAYVPSTNRASKVPFRVFHTDGDDTVYVNQKKDPEIDGRFVSLGKFRFEKGSQWFVMVSTGGADGHVVVDAVQFLLEGTSTPIAKDAEKAPNKASATLAELEDRLTKLNASGPARAKLMAVLDADKGADTHIAIRGNFHNKGAIAPRGVLQVLAPSQPIKIGAGESGRLQLASWLVSKENPLTPRVTANRLWHHLFGAGIVRTVDNFGATGELPSHPELLDYLASRLVENGWSTKKTVREIVLSRAFQMESDPHPAAEKVDPENRLLARQNRRRLDAESIRDAMLVSSATLDRTMFGPTSVANEKEFKFADTRRSVYTPVLRNKLLELFEAFDFADPNSCMGRRNVSTVAPQALFFMNSPFVMDQAKSAAARTLKSATTDDERLTSAYRTVLGRAPTTAERTLMRDFLKREAADPARAWERVHQALYGSIDFRYLN